MKPETVKQCVLCEKAAKDCHCNFKTPKKGKWRRKSELWTTSPRTLKGVQEEIKNHLNLSGSEGREFIFKICIIELKPALPPENKKTD